MLATLHFNLSHPDVHLLGHLLSWHQRLFIAEGSPIKVLSCVRQTLGASSTISSADFYDGE